MLTEDCFVAPPEKIVAACDENTIGVVAILGTTYSGHFEDVEGIDKAISARAWPLLVTASPTVSLPSACTQWLCSPVLHRPGMVGVLAPAKGMSGVMYKVARMPLTQRAYSTSHHASSPPTVGQAVGGTSAECLA